MRLLNFKSSLFIALLYVCVASADRPFTSVKQGDLEGVWQTSRKGLQYAAFMGIPYAKPPVGPLRFEPPKKADSWSGVLDAGDFRSPCIAYEHVLGPDKHDPVVGEEDCLFLNVYTPRLPKENAKDEDLLDVVFYIHGGAFMFGGSQYYGAKYLMDIDVVLVTMNYRLGPMGFLSLEDEIVPGNNGLRDQRFAMEWVNKNIRSFGGNPEQVTLMGLSAGGASVHYHLLKNDVHRLFKAGISMSGTATCPWALVDNARERALTYATSLGCDVSEGSEKIVECLKGLPADDLMRAVEQFLVWQYSPFSPFGPVVEINPPEKYPAFLYHPPANTLLSGMARRIPWMVGTVESEGLYPVASFIDNEEELKRLDEEFDELVPFLLDFNHTVKETDRLMVTRKIRQEYFGDKKVSKETTKELIKMASDRLFLVDAQQAAEIQGQFGPTFFYKVTRRPSTSLSDLMSGTNNNYGTSHVDDLSYIMNMTFYGDNEKTGDELEFMEMMLELWRTFIKMDEKVPHYKDLVWSWVDPEADFNYALLDKVPGHIAYDNDMGNAEFWLSLPIEESTQRTSQRRKFLRDMEKARDEL
ncbi:carboxylic ester hydrolase-like [Neocloeon triangulifer]|uniref:carboxylic ester hydrolase-like n=1 Tax=Neocloeon triangulifer TaxID=2078957 RepID=UPI00286EE6BE|nr:carboxylic ester hydrolase-like [Neocloeon triangulifer]